MEWTDAATSELESILNHLRTSLDPQEVDIDEVAEDIRIRIESELAKGNGHTVTADQVRAAASGIGVYDCLPNPEKTVFVQTVEKPKRIRKRIGTGWFWFSGIILPLLALGTEALTHLCLEAGLADPLVTPVHGFLILLVPLANYSGWLVLRKNKSISIKALGFIFGTAVSVSVYYTLMFITVTPFAIMGFAAVIYFGIGLLCFLPLAPLLSIITTLRMHTLLKRNLERPLPLFKVGILSGIAAIILVSAPMYVTTAGLTMAVSDIPETQLKGIRLLRVAGDDVLLNRACYRSLDTPADPISWLITGGKKTSPLLARDIYYRVTGTAFNTVASPTLGVRSRRNPGDEFDWDPEQGGDVVAGRVKGLSMMDSRVDGVVHPDAATAYLEWTMVFRNDYSREREARAQIALPPGAVVSRLTLWIDGEEREAAFGGRSQVKKAYKKVVRRRRDPVLVTTCGKDRVLMQCYPVPANGEMKIRIGITAPLLTPSEQDRRLRLPHLIERNFRIPEKVRHAVWIEDFLTADLTDTELTSSSATIRTQSSVLTCWAEDQQQTVKQQIQKMEKGLPDQLIVVVDSSRAMEGYLDLISTALKDVSCTLLVADDVPVQCENTAVLRAIPAAGGKNNSAALREALLLSEKGQKTCVVWIHGPQTWSLDSGENVRQAMERQQGIELIEFQVGHGPHRLIEKLDNLKGFHSFPRTASPEEDLEILFRSLSGNSPVWKAVRTSVNTVDPAFHKTDTHLVRLFALDQIKADLSDQNPDNSKALALALHHHLVTPVSGAVVLETQQQFREAGLEPVDSNSVPSVPEPGVWILLVISALFIFFGRRMVHRVRAALEL